MDEAEGPLPKFEDYFPQLISLLKNDPPEGGDQHCWYSWGQTHCRLEIDKLMKEEWDALSSFSQGSICGHVLQILFLTLKSEGYSQLSERNKNICLWFGIFHDIAKRGRPALKGRDPVHPFRSAAQTLRILTKLGWWNPTSATSLDKLCDTIYAAKLEEQKKEGIEEIHDNSKLDDIYCLSEEAGVTTTNEIDTLFRLILLHQSFTVVQKYPARAPLENKELIKKWLPCQIHWQLLEILMVCDSLAYTLESSKTSLEYEAEIKAKLDEVRKKAIN